jgi:PKD repeat protein
VPVKAGTDPIAAFSLNPNPANFGAGPSVTVSFDASASIAGAGAITNYQWDFGDSTPIKNGVALTHDYTAKGTYTITLTVTQTNGRTTSTSHTLLVQ